MRVGWIGTGVMGQSMAGHLQRGGHELYVFNRTRAKADPLLQKGAQWCNSPAEVAECAETVFTIIGFPADVQAVYFGQQGLFSCGKERRTLVDMTTTEPTLARKIAEAAAAKGWTALDAPVSGGDVGAREGALVIMAGGERAAFDAVTPLFRLMGKSVAHVGPAGAGQHMKACNQILITGTMISLCESLLYAEKAGVDPQSLIDLLSKGAAGSWALSNMGPRVLKGDYEPGFYVEHYIKDMGIALKEAAAMKLALPGLALVHQLYLAVQAQGRGRLGTQALILALRALNGASAPDPK